MAALLFRFGSLWVSKTPSVSQRTTLSTNGAKSIRKGHERVETRSFHQKQPKLRADISCQSKNHTLSTMAAAATDDPWGETNHGHCKTCTCEKRGSGPEQNEQQQQVEQQSTETANEVLLPPCGIPVSHDPLPPPLPEPSYSVRRRILPDSLIALNSTQGRKMLLQSLTDHTAASYICLTEQFVNQTDPAFCGVTTLLMVLNSLAIDPGVRWRGGWRYFGDESVLLNKCCLSEERIARIGITMEEFSRLAACQGLRVTMKRPITEDYIGEDAAEVNTFREDVRSLLTESPNENEQQDDNGILVVSFSRSTLGQTGDGHFSPVAAYHEATDQCLVLDVARFKYQPYWVSVEDLYAAMRPADTVTQQPRGWYLLNPPARSASFAGTRILTEERRPAGAVPLSGQDDSCPVHEFMVEFCPARPPKDERKKDKEIASR